MAGLWVRANFVHPMGAGGGGVVSGKVRSPHGGGGGGVVSGQSVNESHFFSFETIVAAVDKR